MTKRDIKEVFNAGFEQSMLEALDLITDRLDVVYSGQTAYVCCKEKPLLLGIPLDYYLAIHVSDDFAQFDSNGLPFNAYKAVIRMVELKMLPMPGALKTRKKTNYV